MSVTPRDPWTSDTIATVLKQSGRSLAAIAGQLKHLIHKDGSTPQNIHRAAQAAMARDRDAVFRVLESVPAEIRTFFWDRGDDTDGDSFKFLVEIAEATDEHVLDLIRRDPYWLGVTPVLERIAKCRTMAQSDDKATQRAGLQFIKALAAALSNPERVTHRPRWYSQDLLRHVAAQLEARAAEMQARYLDQLSTHPGDSLLDHARALRAATLDTGSDTPGPDDATLYAWLGAQCAAIRSLRSAGGHVVHLGMDGWACERMLAIVTRGCELSADTVLRALHRSSEKSGRKKS